MKEDIPKSLVGLGLEEWYTSLKDEEKRIFLRYLNKVGITENARDLLLAIARASNEEENYNFAMLVASYGIDIGPEDMTSFLLMEELITALVESEQYEEAKEVCFIALEMFPKLTEKLIEANNGNIPKKMACRNRLIDIVVGVDGDYDFAERLLHDFVDKGILQPEELSLRLNSLKIHRLQRGFDMIFTLRPKEN
ncbi:MAG: hypothetical protein PWQ88_269 [Candidatus Methanomethylophilaceae archaeon]|nr:MAG: Uncharacterized protein XE11_0853 [Methanomicrobiales archaeon 53_19]MDI3482398.1 hypothetical protein [Candidatus Methanomethylophilaceae archaeon]HIJ00770.1 hypothetical protein [Candidatus Methanomethylophilaceae archaeon]